MFTATAAFVPYLLGFEFHLYSTRELIQIPDRGIRFHVTNQAVAYAVSYAIVLPVSASIFLLELLPPEFAGWFYTIVILEHASQEGYRILVATRHHQLANLSFFLRNGAWCFAATAVLSSSQTARSLNTIWAFWSVGAASSLVPFLLLLAKPHRAGGCCNLDWRWIMRGSGVSIRMLFASLATRGIYVIDRYALDAMVGLKAVGIYTFFLGIANAAQSLTDASVIAKLYPELVYSYRQESTDDFRKNARGFARAICLTLAIIYSLIMIGCPLMLMVAGRTEYLSHIDLLLIHLSGVLFFALSAVPHFSLYAGGRDKEIFISHFIAFGTFAVAIGPLTGLWGASGTAGAVAFGLLSLLISKLLAARRLNIL